MFYRVSTAVSIWGSRTVTYWNYGSTGLALLSIFLFCCKMVLFFDHILKFVCRSLEVPAVWTLQLLTVPHHSNVHLQQQKLVFRRQDVVWAQHIGMKLLITLVCRSWIRLSWIDKRFSSCLLQSYSSILNIHLFVIYNYLYIFSLGTVNIMLFSCYNQKQCYYCLNYLMMGKIYCLFVC